MHILKKCDIIILILKPEADLKSNPNETLFGFCGMTIIKQKKLYLDIICKNPQFNIGFGKRAIQEIETIAKNNKLETIELSAIKNAVEFYIKMGYEKLDPNCSASECKMQKKIKTSFFNFGGKKTKTKLEKRKLKKTKKNKNKKK